MSVELDKNVYEGDSINYAKMKRRLGKVRLNLTSENESDGALIEVVLKEI